MEKKNVYTLTFFNQAPLLHIHLEQLAQSPIINEFKVMLFTEVGYDKENDEVIARFPHLDLEVIAIEKDPRDMLVGMRNILTSYVRAMEKAKEFVVAAETDILITNDALEYYKYIYHNFLVKYPRILSAAHKVRSENGDEGDPEILICEKKMTSPTVISVENIKKYLVPYLDNPDIFHDPPLFYSENFPKAKLNHFSHLNHDGFWDRVVEKHDLFVIRPDLPRSGHCSLEGINQRGKAPVGTLEERIVQWRVIMKDGNLLKSLSLLPHDVGVARFGEEIKWNKLEIDVDRTKCKASTVFEDQGNEFKKYIESCS